MLPRLIVSSPSLESRELQKVTLSLLSSINRHTDSEAAVEELDGSAGDRGGAIAIGTLLPTFLSSGAAVGPMEVFRSYFDRAEGVEFEIVSKDSSSIRSNSKNSNKKAIAELAELAKALKN